MAGKRPKPEEIGSKLRQIEVLYRHICICSGHAASSKAAAGVLMSSARCGRRWL